MHSIKKTRVLYIDVITAVFCLHLSCLSVSHWLTIAALAGKYIAANIRLHVFLGLDSLVDYDFAVQIKL